jgi:hypothetical protein
MNIIECISTLEEIRKECQLDSIGFDLKKDGTLIISGQKDPIEDTIPPIRISYTWKESQITNAEKPNWLLRITINYFKQEIEKLNHQGE